MSGTRFLVFGGDGQLGRELQHISGLRSVNLVALARKDVDITDPCAVRAALDRFAPDIAINAAAFTKVDAAEEEQATAWSVNCDGAGIVAGECAIAGVPLVHISTDYVFDGTKASAYTEEDAVAPLGAYGLSKEAGERAVREACSRHLIIRTGWLFGCHGANFLKTIVELALKRDVLRVVADQIGTPTPSEDLADAILRASNLALASDGPWGTYHFAGAGDASRYDLAQEIVTAQSRWTGRHPSIEAITTAEFPTPARRPANSRLDNGRFAMAFGVTAPSWKSRVPTIVETMLQTARTSRGPL